MFLQLLCSNPYPIQADCIWLLCPLNIFKPSKLPLLTLICEDIRPVVPTECLSLRICVITSFWWCLTCSSPLSLVFPRNWNINPKAWWVKHFFSRKHSKWYYVVMLNYITRHKTSGCYTISDIMIGYQMRVVIIFSLCYTIMFSSWDQKVICESV